MSEQQSNTTVSAVSVIDLANELLERGCINPGYLNSLGDDFQNLYLAWKADQTIQEARLPEYLLTRLWSVASEQGISDLGLDIGAKVNDQARGVLANWMFQCNTLSEVFSVFSQNIHLLNASEAWTKTELPDQIKLSVHFNSQHYPSIAIDRSMSAIMSWSSALTGQSIKPSFVTFTRPEPDKTDRYEEIFGPDITFGLDENALVFPRCLFELPVQHSNPYLKKLLKHQAEALSQSLSLTGSFTDKYSEKKYSEKVRTFLKQDLQSFCQIDAMCAVLHVSRSTLYRKLKMEETSFSDLVKEARLAKIQDMINQHKTPEVLSELLGFSDVGSYYRFKRIYCK